MSQAEELNLPAHSPCITLTSNEDIFYCNYLREIKELYDAVDVQIGWKQQTHT